jgi:hypothetical protein
LAPAFFFLAQACSTGSDIGDPQFSDVACSISQSELLALPLNIFWWHEIVNLDKAGPAMPITHFPLTGSSLAFDRSAVARAEFGDSGLLHPDTRVISGNTGFGRGYTAYPSGSYDNLQNPSLLFPGNVDNRRPPKERVLGVPLGSWGNPSWSFGTANERRPWRTDPP